MMGGGAGSQNQGFFQMQAIAPPPPTARAPQGDPVGAAIGSANQINGLYKAELIHRRVPWKTKESVELATLEWVAWFNHYRLMEPLGYIPPAEAEANYWRQQASQTTTVAA